MRTATRIELPTLTRIFWVVFALGCACDPGPPEDPDAGPEAFVTPRFAPTPDPIDFGEVPFPDDLYLDENGRIAMGRIPSEDTASPDTFPDALRNGLAEIDGFSAVAPAFFYFPPHSLDWTSFPETPLDSIREDASVFLMDVDPASPNAFRRIPAFVHWQVALGQLVVRPWEGHSLVPGRRYAAVVTTSVLDDRGRPIGPDPRFAAVRDAEARPEDPVLAEAYDRYGPVLASLASNGFARERVAGLAVFTVQSATPDLRDARDIVWNDTAPAVSRDSVTAGGAELDALLGTPESALSGTDVTGGVVHANITFVVSGRFASPNFMSASDVHGRFERGTDGSLTVKRSEEVPFTLVLPAGDLTRVPLIVFQHGFGGERSDVFAIADTLAAAGFAVLAIDIPYHGMRAIGEVIDVGHRFGTASGPDGFGDRRGMDVQLEYLGALDSAGELPAFHPSYVRDVLRQSVVDLMRAVRVVREGDWTEVRSAHADLATLGFATEKIGFVGVSLGGIVGTIFVAVEPEIGAAVLNVTGGDLSRLVEGSATFSSLFTLLLLPKLGLDPAMYEPSGYPLSIHPELALYQTVLDRGDSMTFGPALLDRSVDLLFQMAYDDEVVPNRSTEALARISGAQIVEQDPLYTDLERVASPLVGNREVAGVLSTRGLYRFAPATHGLLSDRTGTQRFAHPVQAPFAAVEPVAIANPIDAAQAQVVHFFLSWRSGGAEIASPPP